MEQYEIIIIKLTAKTTQSLLIDVDEAETSETITIHAQVNGQTITSSNDGYFFAYQEFRDQLLKLGYGIPCSGSRLNAVQSAMMSGTDKIYLVKPGKPARSEDLVHIWDYDAIDSFPNTNDQNAFLEHWTARKPAH